jgi:ethanolamine utilization protein EutQ
MSVEHYRPADISAWAQHTDRQIFLADVKDSSNSESMSVWFGRYGAGAQNDWIVTYDEMIVVIKGRFTVRDEQGAKTAGAGEVLFLTRGTRVTYAAEEATELVGATYPHWQDAQRRSAHARMLEDFHPV